MIVKRVGVASVAKIYGTMLAALGLVIGVFFALASIVGAGMAENTEAAFLGPIFGVGAIIFAPIFYGVVGLISGAIGAVLYNVFAGMVGGVQVEVE